MSQYKAPFSGEEHGTKKHTKQNAIQTELINLLCVCLSVASMVVSISFTFHAYTTSSIGVAIFNLVPLI